MIGFDMDGFKIIKDDSCHDNNDNGKFYVQSDHT